MKYKALGIILSSVLLLSLLVITPGCTLGGSAASNVPEPDFAGAMVEEILIALNNGDFLQFSKYFDEGMKKAITEESFNTQFITNIKGKIGNYEVGSKRFFSAATQAQYTTVVYTAVFTDEPGAALVQVSFQMVNVMPLLSGIVFNSPKLRS